MLIEFLNWIIANLVFFWLIIAILFLVLEMGSPGLFFFVSFFFGALIAAGMTFFTYSLIIQSFVFLISSFLSFIVLHFWIKKKILKVKDNQLTNIYALKGKKAKVLKDIIPPESGKVKVYGEIWSARTFDREPIIKDEYIEIIDIRGSHLIVKKYDNKIKNN